jgi:hypothetical protein
MFERIREWRARARTVDDVAALSERELADLGLGRDQAMRLAAAPADTADRMERMAAIFGVSAEAVHRDHGTLVALAETCAGCTERGACASVLALEETAPGTVSDAECGFCANAADYRLLRAFG